VTTTCVTADDRRSIRAWVELPHRIYEADPAWTPPLHGDSIKAAKGLGPSGVTTARFVVFDGDGPVGRIAVSDEPNGAETGTALLTDYEAVDDPGVASALLDAAADWARRRSRDRLTGPRGRLLFGMHTGLQIEGFDYPAPVGTPHHRPYYRSQWESVMGMRQIGSLASFALSGDGFVIPEAAIQVEAALAAAGYRVVRYRSLRSILRNSEAMRRLTNAAMGGLPDWLPLHESDLAVMATSMKRVLGLPDLFCSLSFAGEMVGYTAAYPEVGAALRRCRGRLLPTGWWQLLRARRRSDTVSLLIIALLPEHQSKGAGTLMALQLARAALAARRFRRLEILLIDTENDRSMKLMSGFSDASETSRYAVYERSVL
jgi:GNAT superfamily N-acetyltransferase